MNYSVRFEETLDWKLHNKIAINLTFKDFMFSCEYFFFSFLIY